MRIIINDEDIELGNTFKEKTVTLYVTVVELLLSQGVIVLDLEEYYNHISSVDRFLGDRLYNTIMSALEYHSIEAGDLVQCNAVENTQPELGYIGVEIFA